jgi:aspartokinase-like uncharacterized kinase
MSETLTVAKVGGSLYSLRDLQSRLYRWLNDQADDRVLLVPGGGATADVVRGFDECHALGEEKAHWLALRALSLNAAFLAALLPEAAVVDYPDRAGRGVSILDAFAFVSLDERRHANQGLPHAWAATSDSVAARAAIVGRASRLLLLKSVTIPHEIGWVEAGRLGFVDPLFATLIFDAPGLAVEAVNLRL